MASHSRQLILFGDDLIADALAVDNSVTGDPKVCRHSEAGHFPASAGWGARLTKLYSRKADIVLRGYLGYTSLWGLNLLPSLFPEGGGKLRTLVVISFGFNDALTGMRHVSVKDFKINMTQMVLSLKERLGNCRVVLITHPPSVEKVEAEDPSSSLAPPLPPRPLSYRHSPAKVRHGSTASNGSQDNDFGGRSRTNSAAEMSMSYLSNRNSCSCGSESSSSSSGESAFAASLPPPPPPPPPSPPAPQDAYAPPLPSDLPSDLPSNSPSSSAVASSSIHLDREPDLSGANSSISSPSLGASSAAPSSTEFMPSNTSVNGVFAENPAPSSLSSFSDAASSSASDTDSAAVCSAVNVLESSSPTASVAEPIDISSSSASSLASASSTSKENDDQAFTLLPPSTLVERDVSEAAETALPTSSVFDSFPSLVPVNTHRNSQSASFVELESEDDLSSHDLPVSEPLVDVSLTKPVMNFEDLLFSSAAASSSTSSTDKHASTSSSDRATTTAEIQDSSSSTITAVPVSSDPDIPEFRTQHSSSENALTSSANIQQAPNGICSTSTSTSTSTISEQSENTDTDATTAAAVIAPASSTNAVFAAGPAAEGVRVANNQANHKHEQEAKEPASSPSLSHDRSFSSNNNNNNYNSSEIKKRDTSQSHQQSVSIHISNATPAELERLKQQLAVTKAQTLQYSVTAHMKALEEYSEALLEIGRSTNCYVLDLWTRLHGRTDRYQYIDGWKLSAQGHTLLYDMLVEIIDEQEPDFRATTLASHGPSLEELLANPAHPFHQRPSLQRHTTTPVITRPAKAADPSFDSLPSAMLHRDPSQVSEPESPSVVQRAALSVVTDEMKHLAKLPGSLGLTFLPSRGPVKGLSVSAVKAGSTAEDAGICKGDMLLELKGTPILDQKDYEAAWKYFHPSIGSLLTVKVLRESQLLDLEVVVGCEGYTAEQIRKMYNLPKPPPSEAKPKTMGPAQAERIFKATIEAKKRRQSMVPHVDLSVREYISEEGVGILVTKVIPGDAADLAQLQKGDLLLVLAGVPLGTMIDFKNAWKDKEPGSVLALTFMRSGVSMETLLTIGAKGYKLDQVSSINKLASR